MDYFLKSARLGFRCWTTEDLLLAMGLWGDREVTTYLGGHFTSEMVRARLAKEIEQMKQHGMQYWPLFLLDSDQHVGCAGLRPYRMEERVYEFGVHLRRTSGERVLRSKLAARSLVTRSVRSMPRRCMRGITR